MDRDRRDRGEQWVARVVAWHNRHPLARRIAPAQVVEPGWIELPFQSSGEGEARARWRAVFRDRVLPRIAPKRVARWALRHGSAEPPARGDGGVVQVRIDTSLVRKEGRAERLWLPTAAIADGGRLTAVLIGVGDTPAVLGRRLPHRPRQAAAAALAAVVLVSPAAWWWRPHPAPERPAAAARASAPGSPASAAVHAKPPTAVAPPDVAVSRGRVALPVLKPALGDGEKQAARQAAAALRAQRGATVFAVAMKPVRTRAESERLGAVLKSAAASTMPGARVEAFPAGAEWRAVCWPLARREDAERLREALRLRGQAGEVVVF